MPAPAVATATTVSAATVMAAARMKATAAVKTAAATMKSTPTTRMGNGGTGGSGGKRSQAQPDDREHSLDIHVGTSSHRLNLTARICSLMQTPYRF